MTEEFLHYIWKYSLYPSDSLRTTDGEAVRVMHPGILNFDSGPDFFNARLKIGETIWHGNVEIHVRSSDWNRHGHEKDRAYDNVILQVVQQDDGEVFLPCGEKLPTMVLPFREHVIKGYEQLVQTEVGMPCLPHLKKVDPFHVSRWIQKTAVERLEDKANKMKDLLGRTQNDWEETFYTALCRSLGAKLNALPFEMLARSISLKILKRHASDLHQIEALLFGQAGFLEGKQGDEYYKKLRSEYLHLARKFRLEPMDRSLWKFMRLRPPAFPTLRLAQLTAMLHAYPNLVSTVVQLSDLKSLMQLLQVSASDYWNRHYHFFEQSKSRKKKLGKSTAHTIIINTICPFLFVYGDLRDKPELKDRAIAFLEAIPPEKNKIVKYWAGHSIEAQTALETQGLIQLKNRYCELKKCLNCEIGNYLILHNKL